MRNFGYLKPSRLHNLESFRHKQQDDIFINFERNRYQDKDFRAAVKAIVVGKPIYTGRSVDRLYLENIRERNLNKQREIEERAQKAKQRL